MPDYMRNLLDPIVALDEHLKGIGRQLVKGCVEEATHRGVEWLHIAYTPNLKGFYAACGFSHT